VLILRKKIQEFIDTGKVRYLAELHKEIPDFLIEMVRIPGVGPKTARRIYSKFKPKNLERLERLILSGKLRGMPGIKAKTEEKILSGIDLVYKSLMSESPLGRSGFFSNRLIVIGAAKIIDAKEKCGVNQLFVYVIPQLTNVREIIQDKP